MASLEESLLNALKSFKSDSAGYTFTTADGRQQTFSQTEFLTKIWFAVFDKLGFADTAKQMVNPFALVAFVVTSYTNDNTPDFLGLMAIQAAFVYRSTLDVLARADPTNVSRELTSTLKARKAFIDVLSDVENAIDVVRQCHNAVLSKLVEKEKPTANEIYNALEEVRQAKARDTPFVKRLRGNLAGEPGTLYGHYPGISHFIAQELATSNGTGYMIFAPLFDRSGFKTKFSADPAYAVVKSPLETLLEQARAENQALSPAQSPFPARNEVVA